MDSSFISNHETFPGEVQLGRPPLRFAQLERQHRDICEVQFSALNSSLRESSKDKMLSTLRVTSAMLGNLRQSIVADPQLSMSVQVPKSANFLPGRGHSPLSRQFIGQIPAHPLTLVRRQTSLQELPYGSETKPWSVIQTCGPVPRSDAILAVPTVMSGQSPTSPQKSWKIGNPKFEPIQGTNVRPFFPGPVERPQMAKGLQPSQDTFAADYWPSLKASVDPSRDLGVNPSFGRLPANTSLDPRHMAACERLTQFLRTEVAEGGNLELGKLLLKIQRRA